MPPSGRCWSSLVEGESFTFEGTELLSVFIFESKKSWEYTKLWEQEGCSWLQNPFQLSHKSASINPAILSLHMCLALYDSLGILDFELLKEVSYWIYIRLKTMTASYAPWDKIKESHAFLSRMIHFTNQRGERALLFTCSVGWCYFWFTWRSGPWVLSHLQLSAPIISS